MLPVLADGRPDTNMVPGHEDGSGKMCKFAHFLHRNQRPGVVIQPSAQPPTSTCYDGRQRVGRPASIEATEATSQHLQHCPVVHRLPDMCVAPKEYCMVDRKRMATRAPDQVNRP